MTIYRPGLLSVRGISSGSLPLFLLGGAAFLYLQLFVLPSTPIYQASDQWMFMQDSRRMLDSEVLYRDIFQFVFPGFQAVYAALLRIFGLRTWIPNAVLVVLGVLLAWTTVCVSRKFVSGRNAFLPAALLLSFEFRAWHVSTHHWFSVLAVMAAVLLVLEERKPARLAGAGALCGVSAWFTQTRGPAALLAFAIFVLWESRRENRTWRDVIRKESFLVAGFISTLVLATAYFVREVGLKRFVWCTIVYVVKYWSADSANASYKVYLGSLAGSRLWELLPLLFVYATVPWVYALFVATYRRETRLNSAAPWEPLMLLNLAGIFLFAGIASSPSWFRLCTVSPPALILVVWLLTASARPVCRTAVRFLWIAVVVCAATVLFKTFLHERRWCGYLNLPAGRTAFLDPGPYDEYRWLLGRTVPSDFFFGGRNPYLYFPLGLRNPSDVSFVTANDFTRPEQVRNLVAGLENHRVRFAMWHPELDQPVDHIPAGDHLGPLRAYLHQHYHLVKTFPRGHWGPSQIWQRNDE